MKKTICAGMLCACLLFTGCNKKEEVKPASKQCDGEPQYVATVGDRKVYTYCVTDFSYVIDGETVDLRDYLKSNSDSIDNIIGTLKLKDGWDDGGSEFYEGNKINLVRCNVSDVITSDRTIEGNTNIYIEASGLKEYFCDRK